VIRFDSLLLSAALALTVIQQKGCEKKPSAGGGTGSAAPSAASETDASAAERDVRRKIEELRGALESRMARSVMREIDPTELSAYAGFEDQVTALMDSTSDLRVFFRPGNVQVRPGSGTTPARAQAQVDAEMRYTLKSAPGQEKQKRQQLLMDFVKSESGWRIAKIEPRSFFTP
jgi:hypothetical protein